MIKTLASIFVAVSLVFNEGVVVEGLIGTQDPYYDFVEAMWDSTPDEIKQTWDPEYLAWGCGMSTEEFEYMARVIQAESNGSRDYSDFEDKVLIAAVIFNRVESSSFANSITGVLDEPGQFSTTSGGWCSTESSESSRWAIVIAQRRLYEGSIPDNLLYFNCQGYFPGFEPYCYEGGNYFSLG